jgi:lipoprotein Spr
MVKNVLLSVAILFLIGAAEPATAQKKEAKSDLKFLDDISTETAPQSTTSTAGSKNTTTEPLFALKNAPSRQANTGSTEIEKAGSLQIKFALLMDTEVEQVQNIRLFTLINEWYGTRYQMGGTTKAGIDCSALVQVVFSSVYQTEVPRTAREQYKASRLISRTELKEGDLVFFNTRGGVSHVGIYLQNNKFVHASSSGGVTISDLYDEYWLKKFIGVGRIDKTEKSPSLVSNL